MDMDMDQQPWDACTPSAVATCGRCGRGVGSLDEGPPMLALVSPESADEFSAQFLRYYA